MCRLWQALTVAVSVFAFSAQPALGFAKKQSGDVSSNVSSSQVRLIQSLHPVRASDTILPARANCQSEEMEADCSCQTWQEPVWVEDQLQCRTSSAVYDEQEAADLKFRVAVDSEEGYDGTLRFDVFDREGRIVSDAVFSSVSLSHGAPQELLIPISLNRMGTHHLRMTEVGSGATSEVLEFAVIPKRVLEIVKDADSPFGGILDPNRPEFSFQLGRRIGMRWVRGREWNSFDLELAKLNLMNVIGPWHAESDQQLLHWDATTEAVLDEMDAAEYVTQCRTAYHGAKEQNSDSQVVASADMDQTWIEDALAAGLNGCADVIALKDSGSNSIEPALDQLRTGNNGIGDKPVWVSAEQISEQFDDAESLTKYFVKTLAAGVKKVFVPVSSLVRESGGVRESAVAYATLADRLSGKTFDRRISLDFGTQVYLFTGRSEILAVYWDEQGSIHGVRPLYFSGVQRPDLSGVDLMNNEKPVTAQDSPLLVSDEPRFLLFRNSSTAAVRNWLSYASFTAPQAAPRPPLAYSGGSRSGTHGGSGTPASPGSAGSPGLLNSTWNAASSLFSRVGGQNSAPPEMEVIGSDGEDQERFPAYSYGQRSHPALPPLSPPAFPPVPNHDATGQAPAAPGAVGASQAAAQPATQPTTQPADSPRAMFAPPRFPLASAETPVRPNPRALRPRSHSRSSYQSPIDLYEADLQASDRAKAAGGLDVSTGGGWAFVIVMLVLAGVPLWFLPRSF